MMIYLTSFFLCIHIQYETLSKTTGSTSSSASTSASSSSSSMHIDDNADTLPRPADIYGVEHLVRMLCTLRRNIVCFSTIMIVILSSWLLSFSPLNFFSFFPSFLHLFFYFLFIIFNFR